MFSDINKIYLFSKTFLWKNLFFSVILFYLKDLQNFYFFQNVFFPLSVAHKKNIHSSLDMKKKNIFFSINLYLFQKVYSFSKFFETWKKLIFLLDFCFNLLTSEMKTWFNMLIFFFFFKYFLFKIKNPPPEFSCFYFLFFICYGGQIHLCSCVKPVWKHFLYSLFFFSFFRQKINLLNFVLFLLSLRHDKNFVSLVLEKKQNVLLGFRHEKEKKTYLMNLNSNVSSLTSQSPAEIHTYGWANRMPTKCTHSTFKWLDK